MSGPERDGVVDPWSGEVRPKRPLVSFPLKVLWSAVALLVLGLVVGFLLPGTWQAQRSATIAAPPERVFPLIDSPRSWGEWAPLGDVKATFEGPEHGAGATRRWDDPQVGDGVFTIVSAQPDREVQYRVEVQKGKMMTEGTVTLAPAPGGGTTVTWAERGDFGHNPMLGYIARNMDQTQGAEMDGALRKLAALATKP
jgi:uncharacterized protein YndB with AHSA1/START domain